jgi:hypothetical protein
VPDLTVRREPPYALFRCLERQDLLLDALPGLAENPSASWAALKGGGCGEEFPDRVPRIYADLPTCPKCGGATALLDVLRPR